MRLLVLLLALLPFHAIGAQKFHLEGLMKAADQRLAPIELRKHLAVSNRDSLLRCKAEKRWGLEEIGSFFAAVQIQLRQGSETYLVFPSRYCPEFFGAHSIPFWIMERNVDGTYRQLFWSAEDVVQISDRRTNGYRDLLLQYGFDPPRTARFNGQAYSD
jgi:hypothetical protein